MSDEVQECPRHVKSGPPCEPETHDTPGCGWCIVWRQKARIELLEKTLAAAHDLMVHGAHGLMDAINPRLAERTKGHSPVVTGRAKRTRGSRRSRSRTASAGDGSTAVDVDGAGASGTSIQGTWPSTSEKASDADVAPAEGGPA